MNNNSNPYPQPSTSTNRESLCKWVQSLSPKTPTNRLSPQALTHHIYTLLLQIQPTTPTPATNKTPITKIQQTNLQQNQQLQLYNQTQIQSQNQNMNQFQTTQDLWTKNEYFMQCLNEISEDVLYFVYVGDQGRSVLPKCLIGYYEIVKNLLWIGNIAMAMGKEVKKQGGQSMKSSRKGRNSKQVEQKLQEKQQSTLPVQIQHFLKHKVIRIMLTETPCSYIRHSLSKLQQSSQITQNFRSQLSTLLNSRFAFFRHLFSLHLQPQPQSQQFPNPQTHLSHKLTEYFMHELLIESSQEDLNLSVSLDAIMLCIVYSVYRVQHYSILFSTIVDIYEKKCDVKIAREILLEFYNGEFIIKLLPQGVIDVLGVEEKEGSKGKMREMLMGENLEVGKIDIQVKQDRQPGSMGKQSFQCDQVKQQKSIYDMFQ